MRGIVVSVPQSKILCRTSKYSILKSNLIYFFKRYGMVTFFIAVLFVGMILGAVKAGSANEELLDKIDVLFSGSISIRGDQTPAGTFINSFGTSFLFLALIYCFSMSPLGIIAIPLVMLFRGFGYGISSGFLCLTYGIKGLFYYILVMLIGAFISSLSLVYASQYCMDFSVSMLLSILGRPTFDGRGLKSKMSTLTLNCAYMIILIVFASLVDTGLYYLIGGLFSF